MARVIWTRDELVHYLNDNANWRELQRSNAQRAEDLSTPTLRRYVGRLWRAEKDGEWLADRAALRGHRVSENKPKNRARKKGFEDWTPPVTVPRGTFLLPGKGGRYKGSVRVTGGQATAARYIGRIASSGKPAGVREQVMVNVTGGKPGQYKQLFTKGGWDAARLLEAAGYRRGARGGWHRTGDGPGLEDFLLDYIAEHANSPERGWRRIALYEVFVFYVPDPQARDQGSRRELLTREVVRFHQ